VNQDNKEQPGEFKKLRTAVALLFGCLLLAVLLPRLGRFHEDRLFNANFQHLGPFVVYPGASFAPVGMVLISTALTIVGIVRNNKLEDAGWALLWLILIFAMTCGEIRI
jgi:hypothetical protein